MYQPKSVYTKIALRTIIAKVNGHDQEKNEIIRETAELYERKACFVSIHLNNGELRGCIGTIEPVTDHLLDEIQRNAIAACSRDSRFNPVTPEELVDIEVSVDVLSIPERIYTTDQLNPSVYGLILSNGFQRGVLLPGLEELTSTSRQIEIVKRKAGLQHINIEDLEMYRFTSTRYL